MMSLDVYIITLERGYTMPTSKSGSTGVNLNQIEYAYAAEDFPASAEFIKVYIPKLMGNIQASPKKETHTINKGVFSNSADTAASGASSVKTQGYIVARVVDKRNHTHPWLFCNNPYYGTDNCPNRAHANTCHHPGSSILAPCYHDHWHYDFNDEPIGGANIPAGAQLMVLIMDNNLNDVWVTRFICHY